MKDFLRAKAAHIRLGAAGERAAVRMLENAGCDILARDCRMRSGEIDMKKIGSPQVPYRFDLVEVIFSRFGLFSMYHRKASFGRRSMERKQGKSGTAPINYFD